MAEAVGVPEGPPPGGERKEEGVEDTVPVREGEWEEVGVGAGERVTPGEEDSVEVAEGEGV